mmetsp:Transcript_75910/g.236301  ORF Transcript_75910/g.236301 Transcript_75910/m.236301 type:complete len:409 (+) Transcript_75910:215-1441(+)
MPDVLREPRSKSPFTAEHDETRQRLGNIEGRLAVVEEGNAWAQSQIMAMQASAALRQVRLTGFQGQSEKQTEVQVHRFEERLGVNHSAREWFKPAKGQVAVLTMGSACDKLHFVRQVQLGKFKVSGIPVKASNVAPRFLRDQDTIVKMTGRITSANTVAAAGDYRIDWPTQSVVAMDGRIVAHVHVASARNARVFVGSAVDIDMLRAAFTDEWQEGKTKAGPVQHVRLRHRIQDFMDVELLRLTADMEADLAVLKERGREGKGKRARTERQCRVRPSSSAGRPLRLESVRLLRRLRMRRTRTWSLRRRRATTTTGSRAWASRWTQSACRGRLPVLCRRRRLRRRWCCNPPRGRTRARAAARAAAGAAASVAARTASAGPRTRVRAKSQARANRARTRARATSTTCTVI